MYIRVYLNPDEVDINDPPEISSKIKNNDKSTSEEKFEIPDVDNDDVIENKTLEKPSSGIIKK